MAVASGSLVSLLSSVLLLVHAIVQRAVAGNQSGNVHDFLRFLSVAVTAKSFASINMRFPSTFACLSLSARLPLTTKAIGPGPGGGRSLCGPPEPGGLVGPRDNLGAGG